MTLVLLAACTVGFIIIASVVEVDTTVKGVGVLEPARVWPVRSVESGLVAEVFVSSGDTVQKGQPLVRLDDLTLRSLLIQLRSNRIARRFDYEGARSTIPPAQRQQAAAKSEASSRLIKAQADLRERLAEFGFGTHVNVDSIVLNHRAGTHIVIDRAIAEVKTAEAKIVQAEAAEELSTLDKIGVLRLENEIELIDNQIGVAEEQLSRLLLRAPFSGIVLTDRIELLVGAAVNKGDLLLEVAEPAAWSTDLYVQERDVREVNVGDIARIEVPALQSSSREILEGHVISVASEPVNSEFSSDPAGHYRVTVALLKTEEERIGREKFKSGYSVRGEIVTRSGRIIEHVWRHIIDRVK
ncbi:MAG: HlyD family efflux transporter periplasmic adaptor subunit [Rhodothermales bacterium]|uniref:HlyD family secretion protein n=1 Tax=Roseibium sp. TaxID=1936156 RepID=UPI00329075E6